eukprot:gene29003-35008_t
MQVTWLYVLVLALVLSIVQGFAIHRLVGLPFKSTPSSSSRGSMKLTMGGNKAAFGFFSPAVVAAKFALGEAKFNKLRGKAISLHSQAITEWCLQYGAYNMRLKLIRMAKQNGDKLGFLI